MNIRHFSILVLLSALFFIWGCGSSNTDKQTIGNSVQIPEKVSTVAVKPTKARQALDVRGEKREPLIVQAGTTRLQAGEESNRLSKEKLARMEFDDTPATAGKGDKVTDSNKVAILGAKALAEYKALKLENELRKIKGALQQKEHELQQFRQEVAMRNGELQRLQDSVEQCKTAGEQQITELATKVNTLAKQLQERTQEAVQLRSELENKAGEMVTLKKAVAEADKVKAVVGSEFAAAKTELDEAKQDLAKAASDLAAVQSENEHYQKLVQGLEGQKEEYQRRLDEYVVQVEKLQAELNEKTNEAAGLRAQIGTLQAKLKGSQPSQKAADSVVSTTSTIDQLLSAPVGN